jgi:Fic family protein
LQVVRNKQARLFELYESISPEAFDNLKRAQRIDIVYTSNALEGSALSADETMLVIEKGIAVGGKPIDDHLKALDHAHALDTFEEIGMKDNQCPKFRPISRGDLTMANYLLLRLTNWGVGTYVRLTEDVGSNQFDEPPEPVIDLCRWLRTQPDTPETAISAHHRLIGISPFIAANAPTARLLLNFILMRGGYPPIAIKPEDGASYSAALHSDTSSSVIDTIVLSRLSQTLDLYIEAAEQART